MKRIIIISSFLLAVSACTWKENIKDMEIWKKEVEETEKAFAEMVKTAGLKNAFLYFADEEAVLSRQNNLYQGKNEIERYFVENELPYEDVQLEWTPKFIDVSSSGDLAYTFGDYLFSFVDSSGVKLTDTGIFHTVWKRQADGSWRYVWD